MSDLHSLSDLIARSLQHELSPAEQGRMERGIEASAVLRVIRQTSQDFEPLAEVRPGDDQLAERLVVRVLDKRGSIGRTRWRKHLLALPLGIAALLIGATALGYWGVSKVHTLVSQEETGKSATSVRRTARAQQVRIRKTPVSAIPAEPMIPLPALASAPAILSPIPERSPSKRMELPEVSAEKNVPERSASVQRTPPTTSADGHVAPTQLRGAEPSLTRVIAQQGRRPEERAASGTASVSQAEPDAAALFKMALAARRDGRKDEAIQTLQKLHKKHPQSPETEGSHLSLAALLLERGDAKEALSEYKRVPERHAQEGLFGEVQAYDKLGLKPKARSVREQLCEQFSYCPSQARDQAQGTLPAASAE